MTVNAEHPIDILRNFVADVPERRRQGDYLRLAGFSDLGRSLVEQHFRLKNEPVADYPDTLLTA